MRDIKSNSILVRSFNKETPITINVVKKIEKEVNISIIIRCKNEETNIRNCIEKIQQQLKYDQCEIIIIDSGSSDNTIEIAKEYDVNIYSIQSNEFNFGTSILLGNKLACIQSKYCVFISAHAIPANEFWLENLINKFSDEYVVATYSKQVYYDNTSFIEKRSLEETFGDKTIVQEKVNNMKKYVKYKKNITFSNASSCIRRDIIEKIPFRDIIASEDKEWAYRVLSKNYKIIYASDSIIYHCHNESLEKYYDRIYINSKALYEFSGFKINAIHIIPLIVWNVLKDMKYLKKNKIRIDRNSISISVKYRYKYAIAHYKATREK